MKQRNLTVIDTPEKANEVFGKWRQKMDYLLNQIHSLKQSSDPATLISAFLLETQYIEFHLQGLLSELDLVRYGEIFAKGYKGRLYKEKKGEKKPLEYFILTFGQLKNEIGQYETPIVKILFESLEQLTNIRNQFAHNLLSYSTGIEELINEAKKGINLNTKSLVHISEIFQYIEKNTTIGKILVKKVYIPEKT